MIKKILALFFPEKINNYTILSTKVVGISIEKEAVTAVIVIFQGTSITVQETFIEPFDTLKNTRPQKIAASLKSLLGKIGKYDRIVTSIPSMFVTFKELSLPFTDAEKIRMILRYEIEGGLPFPPDQACIDFLITKEYPEENRSDVIVAAIQKKWLEEYLKPFEEAEIEVAQIGVDILGVYTLSTLLKEVPDSGNEVLLYCEENNTKIIFITNSQLKQLRTLRQGLSLESANTELWKEINFTLQSFASEITSDQKIQKIVVFGEEPLLLYAKENLPFPCERFDIQKLVAKKTILLSGAFTARNIPLSALITALPCAQNTDFSLQLEPATPAQKKLLQRQIITGALLAIATVVLLSWHSFSQIRKFKTELEISQKEVLETLKAEFPFIKGKNIKDLLETAQKDLKKEEEMWDAFSNQTRQSALRYLYDLSTQIDRETLGLELTKMTINKNFIKLEGSVRSFDAIQKFEEQLKETKLFTHVDELQKLNFVTQLPLAHKGVN